MNQDSSALMTNYKRIPITFVSGSGCTLVDDTGKEYLDGLAGIAVVSAGHGNAEIADAVAAQLRRLGHVSNFFFNEPLLALAQKLQATTGGWGRSFFCNSGAEANECAIKLVRKWAGPKRYKIICANKSFHGRTLAALAATGQPAKWEGFQPLPAGFVHVDFNDLSAFEDAVDEETAGIMIEPIQGEGGVVPGTQEFLSGIRRLTKERNLALVFDEVQSGVGRTGKWWAFQQFGITPDIFTSAKALGNGFPIGACVAAEPFASVLVPGDHASTFGGNPVACAAALATLEFLESHSVLATVAPHGALFAEMLQGQRHVVSVRGLGLLQGVLLDREISGAVVDRALQKGLILNAVTTNIIRFAPPLVITTEQIKQAAQILCECLSEVA